MAYEFIFFYLYKLLSQYMHFRNSGKNSVMHPGDLSQASVSIMCQVKIIDKTFMSLDLKCVYGSRLKIFIGT